LDNEGSLVDKGNMFTPNNEYLRRIVPEEVHKMPYTRNPSYQKEIASNMKQYFWAGMK